MRALVIALLMLAPATAAEIPHAPLDAQQLRSIDKFVVTTMRRNRIPGAAVGIYSRGTVLLAKGYGLANVEHDVPVKAGTVFQSGSVGKQFVSAAILMLVEEGRIALDDPIAKYFPEAPASWRAIRVEHLLSHTSGLAEYETPERSGPGGPFDLRLDFTEDELATKIAALPIEAAPAAEWDYRNTNYVLLGILIHRVTGMRYGDFLAARIFVPLRMTSTRIVSDTDIVPDRAAGYELKDDVLKNQAWVSATFNSTADGTLYFNVPDVARWDAALDGTTLLSQSSLDRLWTVFPLADGRPNPAGYGLGWVVGKQNEHRRIEHGGAWQGFASMIARYPDDAVTVLVLANLDAGHARLEQVAHVVAGLVEPSLLPPRLVAIEDTQPAAVVALREALDRLVAGRDLAPLATTRFAKAATPAALDGVRRKLSGDWPGATLTLVGRQPPTGETGTTSSLFRMTREDRSMLVSIRLDGAGRIDGLTLSPDRDWR